MTEETALNDGQTVKPLVAVLGDYWHSRAMIEEALQAAERRLGNIRIHSVDAENELLEQLAGRPAAVIIYRCRTMGGPDEEPKAWLSPAGEQAIVQYVSNGGRLLAWHSGLAFYEKESAYVEMLRGRFLHHPPMKNVDYIDAVTGETIMTLFDEHYFVEVDEDRTEVFLYSLAGKDRQIAGWMHAYGQGKVCCLVPAHDRTALHQEKFQRLLCEKLGELTEP